MYWQQLLRGCWSLLCKDVYVMLHRYSTAWGVMTHNWTSYAGPNFGSVTSSMTTCVLNLSPTTSDQLQLTSSKHFFITSMTPMPTRPLSPTSLLLVNIFRTIQQCKSVTIAELINILCIACDNIIEALVGPAIKISSQYLLVGVAIELLLRNIHPNNILLIRMWCSDKMLWYIHVTMPPLRQVDDVINVSEGYYKLVPTAPTTT